MSKSPHCTASEACQLIKEDTMVVQLLICFEQNRKFPVEVCQHEKELAETPVQHLKQKIQERRPDTEKTDMRLIHKTYTLEDGHMLAEYQIKHKSEIQVVLRCK